MTDISIIIKQRLQNANKRFFACDNVSEYINPEEHDMLIDELTEKFNAVLDSLIIDRENDPNSKDTGKRIAKMYYNEIMSGRYSPIPNVTAFPNNNENSYNGMITVRCEVKSMCSHHHQPVTGIAYIGVIPNNKVIGLSKYSRIVQWCARRGTLQEELTNDISNIVRIYTESENVGVYIAADHGCCTNRGIMSHSSLTQTTVLKGNFNDPDVKKEFFDNIALQEKHAK